MVSKSVKKWLSAASFSGFLAVSAASAATVTVSYQGNNEFGTPDYSQKVLISSPGVDGIVNAGPFRLRGDSGFGDFVAFCIDLSKFISSGKSYTTASSSAFGGVVDGFIDRLFTSAYASIDTAIKGAAFQVALWEVITDTGSPYDLNRGEFTAQASWAVRDQANAYLAGLANAATGGYRLTFLTSGASQNLVTVSPVPIPAAAGMLGIGLLGLFGLKRSGRKKAAKRAVAQ